MTESSEEKARILLDKYESGIQGYVSDIDGFVSFLAKGYKEWQNTFDSITDFVSIHDSDFNIIRANMAFAKHFDLHPREVINEVINKKCYEVIHGTDSPVAHCPHKITLDKKRL